eukprot:12399890-Karenia_brevis.AAC.1
MSCTCWGLLFDVIRFSAAISGCERGGQWQCVRPLLNEMHTLRFAAWRKMMSLKFYGNCCVCEAH